MYIPGQWEKMLGGGRRGSEREKEEDEKRIRKRKGKGKSFLEFKA